MAEYKSIPGDAADIKRGDGDADLKMVQDAAFPRRRLCSPCIRHSLGISVLGLLLIVGGLGTYIMWCTDSFEEAINERLILRENSQAAEKWMHPPVSPVMRMWLFNYTNVDAFASGKERLLRLQEVGPYAFREVSNKVDVVFHANSTVTYKENKTYIFLPELSNASMDASLTVINMPLMTIYSKMSNVPYLPRFAMSSALAMMQANPFHKKTAYEVFWGYRDELTTFMVDKLGVFITKLRHLKLGLLEAKQGVGDSEITMCTGEGDVGRMGRVELFDGLPEVDYYRGACNSISGSDGATFPPSVGAPAPFHHVYLRELCRRITLEYKRDVMVFGNIPARRYEPTNSSLGSGEDDCFCSDDGDCPPFGLADVAPCKGGTPIYVSYPHFFKGDPMLVEQVEGLRPITELHESYLNIHQRLGVPVEGRSRLQFSVAVKKLTGTRLMNKIDGKFLPIVWLERDLGDYPEPVRKILYQVGVTAPLVKQALTWATPAVLLLATLGVLVYAGILLFRKALTDVYIPQATELTRL